MINKLKPGKYTLREVTAPNGYEVAEDVTFTVRETGEIQKVAMVDAPKGTTTKKSGGGSSDGSGSTTSKSGGSTQTGFQRSFSNPQTGDTTNIVVWILLLILGGIFFGSVWYRKKELDKEGNA